LVQISKTLSKLHEIKRRNKEQNEKKRTEFCIWAD
jgi:hypothetical protein